MNKKHLIAVYCAVLLICWTCVSASGESKPPIRIGAVFLGDRKKRSHREGK